MTDTQTAGGIELRHNDAAQEWATDPERVPVFFVVRPNPEHEAWLNREVDPTDPDAMADEPPTEVRHEYTMPARPNPGLALKYLKMARENADLAASWLLELAIGSDGYDALVDELSDEPDPEVANATMTAIIQKVAKRALGGLSGKA